MKTLFSLFLTAGLMAGGQAMDLANPNNDRYNDEKVSNRLPITLPGHNYLTTTFLRPYSRAKQPEGNRETDKHSNSKLANLTTSERDFSFNITLRDSFIKTLFWRRIPQTLSFNTSPCLKKVTLNLFIQKPFNENQWEEFFRHLTRNGKIELEVKSFPENQKFPTLPKIDKIKLGGLKWPADLKSKYLKHLELNFNDKGVMGSQTVNLQQLPNLQELKLIIRVENSARGNLHEFIKGDSKNLETFNLLVFEATQPFSVDINDLHKTAPNLKNLKLATSFYFNVENHHFVYIAPPPSFKNFKSLENLVIDTYKIDEDFFNKLCLSLPQTLKSISLTPIFFGNDQIPPVKFTLSLIEKGKRLEEVTIYDSQETKYTIPMTKKDLKDLKDIANALSSSPNSFKLTFKTRKAYQRVHTSFQNGKPVKLLSGDGSSAARQITLHQKDRQQEIHFEKIPNKKEEQDKS